MRHYSGMNSLRVDASVGDLRPSGLGLLGRTTLLSELERLPVRSLLGESQGPPLYVDGFARAFASPITFTPFASVRPCSARCTFCSETLQHRESQRLSASLRPGPRYFAQLAAALRDLREVPLGMSLSGLEQTDDADSFEGVLDAIGVHRSEGAVTDVVLYSNGSGLTEATTGARLLPRLSELTRVELSRHSSVQAANDAIMRFRPDVPVASMERFAEVARGAAEFTHVRLVCVIQRGGVDDSESLFAYLRWAHSLGVRDVVFRELSRLGTLYRPNRTLRLIEEGRVSIESLFRAAVGRDLVPVRATAGYYYWNVECAFEDATVTFETSDYTEMKRLHRSDVVHKLVFHANGTLGADWDPDREILRVYD